MNAAGLLPPSLHLASAVFLVALSALLVAVHGALLFAAAGRSELPARARLWGPALATAFLALWLGVAITVGDGANFPLPASARLPLSLAVGFGTMLLALGCLRGSATLRGLNAAMPPQWLVRVQTYRVAGLIFLFPFLAYGVIPASFALPAAVGDTVVGLLAPAVASALASGRPGAQRWAVAWNLFGILDLVVAPSAALLSHAQIISIYPLTVVALFLGPPLGILTHVLSLRNLGVRSAGAPSRGPSALTPLAT
jgi:hypothetical protein